MTLNGWRAYVPEIGRYTTPEPLHFDAAAVFHGPQAYAYAAGRPFKYVDPDGQFPGDLFHTPDQAATDALSYAVGLTLDSTYWMRNVRPNGDVAYDQFFREYGGVVCKKCDGEYYATKFRRAADGVVATDVWSARSLCGRDEVVATLHSHPYDDVPSPPDRDQSIPRTVPGYVGGPSGLVTKYFGQFTYLSLRAFDPMAWRFLAQTGVFSEADLVAP
ncbi:MAG: hypothetical protein IT379_23460 [Deltaproteobacteria bacterium]|nr:hypothetical protein [Deltaproteobacteria bacterium]